jgi:hypothetical protein
MRKLIEVIEKNKIDFIKEFYPKNGLKYCVLNTGLTKNQVRRLSSIFDLKYPTAIKKWTDEETKYLIDNLDNNLTDISETLGKSISSICKKIESLKLIRKNKSSLILIKKENIYIDEFIKENCYKGNTFIKSELHITDSRIKNSFLRNKILFNKSKWSDGELDFLVKNYNNLQLCCETLKRYEGKILEKANIIGLFDRSSWLNRYRNLNELSIFEIYILGYLWADGHINKKNIVTLGLKESDSITLVDNFVNLGQNWKFIKNKNNLVCSNSTVELGRLLNKYDFDIKSKTQPTKILNELNDNNIRYFLLGLSDGDGCFYCYKKGGTYQYIINSCYEQDWSYIENIYKSLDIKYSIQRLIRKNRDGKHSCIRITNKKDVIKWGEYLYKNYEVNKIGLKRKYDKFLEINH